ncbi:hypothetical protein BDF19DRAFT_454010, partial [Syncephalis fuscata]
MNPARSRSWWLATLAVALTSLLVGMNNRESEARPAIMVSSRDSKTKCVFLFMIINNFISNIVYCIRHAVFQVCL